MTNTPIVLDAVAALGVDVSSSNGIVNVAGQLTFPYLQILKDPAPVIQPYVAEVLQVTNLLFTAGNTGYSINLATKIITQNVPKTFTYTITNASALTATQIAAAFIALINADLSIPITADANGTSLRLTADAGYPIFVYSNNDSSSTVTPTYTTAGVIGYGSGAVLALNPTLLAAGIVAAHNYTTVTFSYYALQSRDSDGFKPAIATQVVYVNEGDTDYLTVVGTYGTLTQALQGTSATWAKAATAAAIANGVVTLGGADIFFGNSDTNLGMVANDVIRQVKSTATTFDNYYILTTLFTVTANTPGTPNDDSTATDTWYIKLRRSI